MAAQMAADGGGLRRLFEKPLPENPTLLEALSAWNHNRVHPNSSTQPIDTASFTEIFGELHFQEKTPPDQRAVLPQPVPAPTTPSWADAAAEVDKRRDDTSLDALLRPRPAPANGGLKRSASYCAKKGLASASSLLLCTEGLGSESTVDADDMLKDGDGDAEAVAALVIRKEADTAEETKDQKEKRPPPPSFPPPIRSIGRGGKPCVCFRSFRADGRFVLLEVLIPSKELLQAYRDRDGGRLRLQFAAAALVGVDDDIHGGGDKGRAEDAFAAES